MAAKPIEPKEVTDAAGAVTRLKPKEIKTYKKDLCEQMQNQVISMQQIASTILDTLHLQIKGKVMVKDTWDALTKKFKTRFHIQWVTKPFQCLA